MEDLYLSATTQLQVIVATEAARQPCRTLLQFSPHRGENSATRPPRPSPLTALNVGARN